VSPSYLSNRSAPVKIAPKSLPVFLCLASSLDLPCALSARGTTRTTHPATPTATTVRGCQTCLERHHCMTHQARSRLTRESWTVRLSVSRERKWKEAVRCAKNPQTLRRHSSVVRDASMCSTAQENTKHNTGKHTNNRVRSLKAKLLAPPRPPPPRLQPWLTQPPPHLAAKTATTTSKRLTPISLTTLLSRKKMLPTSSVRSVVWLGQSCSVRRAWKPRIAGRTANGNLCTSTACVPNNLTYKTVVSLQPALESAQAALSGRGGLSQRWAPVTLCFSKRRTPGRLLP
jgi:hypothetical protein